MVLRYAVLSPEVYFNLSVLDIGVYTQRQRTFENRCLYLIKKRQEKGEKRVETPIPESIQSTSVKTLRGKRDL